MVIKDLKNTGKKVNSLFDFPLKSYNL
jgi:hypothetical protein